MSNEVKSDIQHSGETAVRQLGRRLANLWRMVKSLGRSTQRYIAKNYTNPLKAIKNDGPTKQLSATPLLTKEEAKLAIVKMNEYGILATIKEVDIATDDSGNPLKTEDGKEIPAELPYKGKTLHAQEKMAKNELKEARWKDRSQRFKKISFIKDYAEKRAAHFQSLSEREDRANVNSGKRYVFITNQSNTQAMNDILAQIQLRRIQLKKDGILEDINQDGFIDERDIEVGEIYNLSTLKKEELVEGKDYGDVPWKQIVSGFMCVQIISKDKFIEKNQELASQYNFAAQVYDDEHMKISYESGLKKKINSILQEEHPNIIEFGIDNGDSITRMSPTDSLKILHFDTENSLEEFKSMMGNHDFIITYNENGYEVQVCESELIQADRESTVKKKQAQDEKQYLSKEEDKDINLDTLETMSKPKYVEIETEDLEEIER